MNKFGFLGSFGILNALAMIYIGGEGYPSRHPNIAAVVLMYLLLSFISMIIGLLKEE